KKTERESLGLCELTLSGANQLFGLVSQADGIERNGKRACILVDLADADCPTIAAELEEKHFHFSGLLPLRNVSDYISYSPLHPAELQRIRVYGAPAKALQQYMLADLRKNIESHLPIHAPEQVPLPLDRVAKG